MKTINTILMAALLTACGGPAEKPAEETPEKPVESKTEAPAEEEEQVPDLQQAHTAAELANAIAADPDSAEDLLAERDMTLEDFDAMLFEVAQDPVLAEAYAKARTS